MTILDDRSSVARLRCGFRALCTTGVLLMVGATPLVSANTTLDLEQRFAKLRPVYEQARAAARRGDQQEVDQLRPALLDYPLLSYIDYEVLLRQRYRLDGELARGFVDANSDSPLGVRYLGHYLEAAGQRRRWDDYLEAAPTEPRNEALRCYYYRARLSAGGREEAWEGARRLWLAGRSVDDACDPLFSAWRRAGQLGDELVWQRALLAFEGRQGSLLRYITSLASPALEADLKLLQRVYREPHRVKNFAASVDPTRRADVHSVGLIRLSRYDPTRARREWQALGADQFSSEQNSELQSAIALRGLLDREESLRSWIDGNLGNWRDDRLTELRLRWAIEELDWQALLDLSPHLSGQAAADSAWGYWRARAMEERGDSTAAQALFSEVAAERSYYGFLSADRAGLSYSYNEQVAPTVVPVSQLPTLARQTAERVHELRQLDAPRDAHAEWSHTLPRVDRDAQQQLAALAAEAGWYRFAIDAANVSRSQDLLSLRFPLAYTDVFRAPAVGNSVPLSELMAIARRESAFFPAARSSVGARGLMQLMPATGMSVARKQGLNIATRDLYDIDHNVTLGSAYYRQLLERFDDNRAVALAAYNAGPNRVKNWIGRGLPLDAWIETIPFRETRDYVKAVLAYSVVFDHRLGQKARLLTQAETQAVY